MRRNDSVLITKDISITPELSAKAIYVSASGEVTIIADRFDGSSDVPDLTVDYLDALCSRFYYGGYLHQDAIADIMLLNSVLSLRDYDDFYASLDQSLKNGNVTIISSTLFR